MAAEPISTFHVKNFDKFQHYKDRSPPWIKLYTSLLENYEFARLPDASKAHLLAIWMLASRSNNKLPYDAKWIANRINATCAVELDLLLAFDFIVMDQTLHTPEQTASKPIAECLPRDRGETETEGETETDRPPELALASETVSRETILEEFDCWYQTYPRRTGRGHAWKAYKAARRKTDAETLLRGAERYRDDPGRKPEYTKYPSSWLNGECWSDDAPTLGTAGNVLPIDSRRQPDDGLSPAVRAIIAESQAAKGTAA